MAIYRTGTASLSATGVIKGVGTNWQDKLSLVRVGATMIFQTAPLTICTISSIVSPTEMRATATDGAVVAAGTKYVILLHDSITVDGLAQDVAETLRYYQSKETVLEDVIEFFQNFDWEMFVALGNQVKADASSASTSATNAKTSETNAKTSENAAKASQTAAAGSQSAAAASATAAKTSETNAATSRTAAANSATAASSSASAAKTSETNAKTSETNANASKTAAAGSATAAANSATAASSSASAAKTSETNAKTSETNANASKTAAAGSASAAAGSATTATQQADRAKAEADRAASANPDNQLKKANNLSDVADKAASRNNLDVPGLNNANNTFSGYMVINNQNGITVKPGSGQANGWFVSANSAGVPRYRLGIEANEQFRLYAYDSNGAGGRGVFSYDYASNKATFSSLLASNNLVSSTVGFQIETNSDSTEPSGSLVARRAKANGDVIVTSESRANANGSVEWIKRDSVGTPRGIALTEDNFVQYNGLTPAPPNLEIGIKSGVSASYVDFHYDASKGYDYSARIICDGMNSEQLGGGNLRFYAGYNQISSIGSTNITGGRLLVNTSDVVFDTQVGLAAGSIQVPRVANATAPIGGSLRGVHAGADSANFNNASNINLYSWHGIGFCTAYTSPTNGVIQGKPAVYINTRDGTLNAKGAVQANGVTLTSDWNAKENISIIDPDEAMEMMIKLDGWKFRYKDSDSKRMTAGILAQDLDLVIPDLVIKPEATPEVDIDGNVVIDEETGNPVNDGDSNLTADYMGLMGYMVAAIKHSGMKNDSLQSQVDDLKSQVEELKLLVAALAAK